MEMQSPVDRLFGWLFHAPAGVRENLPEGLRGVADFVWMGLLAVVALIVLLLILVVLWRLLFRRGAAAGGGANLEERLAEYPPAPPSTGDRRLTVEGVPVRMRLVVVAPTGESSEIDTTAIEKMLDRVVPGLGEIFRHDKPRLKVWPKQHSYQGFATHFHRNTIRPEPQGEMSPWVMAAGRVKDGKQQFMLGLAMQGPKPNTVGRRTLDAHQWDSVLRVRVRD